MLFPSALRGSYKGGTLKTFAILLSVLSTLAFGASKDPVGQKAHYQLDTDPTRTSSMIQSGTIDATVGALHADAQPPAYEVQIAYSFDVSFMGLEEGTKTELVDTTYFTPEFMENLRQTGHYESADFKAKYLGVEDAKTLDGNTYPHCDRVQLYDIKQGSALSGFIQSIFAFERADIQDLVIVGDIFPGVPVLGAVKLDASGTYDGMAIKAGGDYQQAAN